MKRVPVNASGGGRLRFHPEAFPPGTLAVLASNPRAELRRIVVQALGAARPGDALAGQVQLACKPGIAVVRVPATHRDEHSAARWLLDALRIANVDAEVGSIGLDADPDFTRRVAARLAS